MDLPEHLKANDTYNQLQITLVDCPGHASLIRTIIGGKIREKDKANAHIVQ